MVENTSKVNIIKTLSEGTATVKAVTNFQFPRNARSYLMNYLTIRFSQMK